ncbi:type II toxin-antitoxin system death-on-curing family toxin [Microbacterium indicum]|uniref:type II toxin-antitoxin system death-on-curing family toxin n=1 Tax=Microbacterium indicum TaxID=358100 RepID=UPI00041CAA89|nr:type II toxin-antitoxin system death-on-curing family toxin [Microbacterium indicum]
MTTEPLTLAQAARWIERSGLRLRDAGLLGSALARPATTFGGDEVYPTLAEKAAVLMDSVARNHALMDGNKRTAWALMNLFLWINGAEIEAGEDEAFAFILDVATGALPYERSALWIGARIRPRPPQALTP